MVGSASRLGPDEDPCVCVFNELFSGISFRALCPELVRSVWSTNGIDYCYIRVVCCTAAAFLRSPRQTLCVFSGSLSENGLGGSEAFLLGTCPAG